MNIKEFSKPVTAYSLNESLAKRFGTKIDVDKFTTEQLMDARNKIRTKLSQVETTESYNAVQQDGYTKNQLFLDVLNAAIAEREDSIKDAIDEAVKTVREGKEDEAEIVMAAKDMVDRITGWMEDTAEMQTESMLELADAIRAELGSERAESFTASIKPALEELYGVMETTRATLTSGVGMLTGETDDMDMMGADDMDTSMEPTVDMDLEADPEADMDINVDDDDFGAAGAAAGGEDLGGREKRESIQHSKKK
jgi:hypothetical protein